MKKRLLLISAFLTAVLALCAAPCVAVRAQDQGQEPAATEQVQAAPDTPARQAYDAKMKEYRNNLKKLRELKASFQTAKAQQKDEIQKEFTPLVQETARIQKELIPLAIKAFAASNGEDSEIFEFLMIMLEWGVIKTENYETAYDIAKVLIPSGKIPEKYSYLYAYAAYAAFNVMQLDDAQAFFDLAKQNGGMESLRKQDPRGEMQIPMILTEYIPMYKQLWTEESAIRDKEAEANDNPRVLIRTTKGDIVLELFLKEAPEAVGNFMTLVDQKYYNGVPFHRVLPHFMAQGGDPTGTGAGGPGYCIKDECQAPNARMHFRGSLSMAKTALPDSGGSQFFLCFVPTAFLNGKHTVFGRVIEGMDILSEIQRIDPEGKNQPAPDKIVEAIILQGKPTPFTKLPNKR